MSDSGKWFKYSDEDTERRGTLILRKTVHGRRRRLTIKKEKADNEEEEG